MPGDSSVSTQREGTFPRSHPSGVYRAQGRKKRFVLLRSPFRKSQRAGPGHPMAMSLWGQNPLP